MEESSKLEPENQSSFAYTEKQIEWLHLCLSPERLNPYYVRARGNHWVALHLYLRNTEISSSLYGVVQTLEVGLRNRVHAKMSDALGTESWWDTLPVHEKEMNDIAEARQNICNRMKQVRPGRIVAELSFGFWVKLFANSYEKELWVPHLSKLFPAKVSRKGLHDRLLAMKEIRNRIAHHETLIQRDVLQDYTNLLETISWISTTLHKWTAHHSNFPAVYARRIPKEPKVETTKPSGS